MAEEEDIETDGMRVQPLSKRRRLEVIKLGELYHGLRSIATEWKFFGLYLLSFSSYKEIKAKVEANNFPVEECLLEILEEWHKKTDIPTCQAVIEALNKMDEHELSSKFLEDCVVEKAEVQPPPDISSQNLRLIQMYFTNLVSEVAARLEGTVNIEEFRLHVATLFQPGDVILEADSITKICTSISVHQLWDYNSPEYVENIVEKFAGTDSDLSCLVSDYESKLIGFKASTKIADFIKVCGDNPAKSNGSIQLDMARYDENYCNSLWVKLKTQVTNRSLIYIDHLWQMISRRLPIEPLSGLLDRVSKGCVEIIWYVPTLSALQIQAGRLPYEFFQEHEIAWMTCDKETLYKEEMNEEQFIAERKKVRKKLEDSLISSARIGNLLTVERLLLVEIDPNLKDFGEENFCWTPLLWACKESHGEVVNKLIEFGADVHAKNSEGWTGLTLSSWNGCFSIVEKLLNSGADINKCNEESNGWTAVMCAAFKGHLSVVNLLIDLGAEVDKQDYTGCTALILASNDERHLNVVELLLEKGANPNIKENHGLCPLLIGAKWNFVNLVRLVCVKSPLTKMDIVDMNSKTALILAAEKGNVDVVRFLLREEFLERINAEHQDENGRAAIHAAAESRNVEVFRLLFNAFPETRDLKDNDGNTPAIIAKRTNNKDLVALLSPEDEGEGKEVLEEALSEDKEQIESAVEPMEVETQTTRRLSTITRLFRSARLRNLKLLRAAKAGNARKVEKLLKSGAEPNTIEIDTLQWTPLMWASQKNHVETVRVLLKYKADPNLQARNGFTALILASRLGNHEVVKVLLDKANPLKTDVQIKNKTRGWSALMWACQSRGKQFDNEEARANRRIVAKYLLDEGADVNSIADNGWTPIMQASQDGDVEMVKLLTSHASSKNSLKIDHESKSTWTALTTACRKKHSDIVKVLVDAGADVNKKKKGGVAPLHIAAIKKMVEASEYLRIHGANVNIQDEWGITPLMLAVKENDREKQDYETMIRYHILDAKAKVNLQAEKFAKWTAVFFSIKNKDQKTSKFLVKNKAEMDIKDEYGHTPFSISKGLILDEKIQMFKFLVNLVYPPDEESQKGEKSQEEQEEVTPEVTYHKDRKSLTEEKSFSVADGAVYAAVDLRFRMTQLPNYLVNFNLNLPAF